jgi:hypothetical protein
MTIFIPTMSQQPKQIPHHFLLLRHGAAPYDDGRKGFKGGRKGEKGGHQEDIWLSDLVRVVDLGVG